MTNYCEYEYTIFGKPVYHPTLKVLAVFLAILFLILMLPLAPVLIPLHFLLRKMGRNGFFFDNKLWFGTKSFARRVEFCR
jgi:hypothetical protein